MSNKAPILDPKELSELKYQLSVLEAEASFYEFYKQAWPIMEGGTPFIDSWVIQSISEHLEACFHRTIKRLLINIPPRTGKTNLISVAFPAWVWIHNAEEKFMYASYATNLSIEHSRKCKLLLESNWYQKRWGHKFQLSQDQKAKGLYDNNKKGCRIATSVGASATGKGASILISDDPNNVVHGDSKVKLDNANLWWDQVWSTRLNNPKNDVKILVQQRVNYQDVSGHLMQNDLNDEWVKLILPMEFEEKNKTKTIILSSTNGKIWEDPRVKEGQSFCDERFSEDQIAKLKKDLGTYAYAAQYQQRPSPADGGILKKGWFQWWKEELPPKIEYILQSWDTAMTAKSYSSYSACTTWGVFYDQYRIENIILLSLWRGKVEYPELRERAKRLYFDYRDTGKEKHANFSGREIDMFLIEAKATGDPLIQDLHAGGIRAIPYIPDSFRDKEGRTRFVSPLIEGGRVWLQAQAPHYNKLVPSAEIFLDAVARYPKDDDTKDIIDTMAQAFDKLKRGKFLLNPRDERPIEPTPKDIRIY